jgi:SOS-response transcriptional repressor LexA
MADLIDFFKISLSFNVLMPKNNTIVLNYSNTNVVCLSNTFALEFISMKYGERLRIAREHKGLTQEELVKISGVKQGTISKIERGGQHSSGFDAVLAYHLDIDAMWLTTGDDKFAPNWLSINDPIESYTQQINEPKVIGEVPLISFAQVGTWSETTINLRPTDGETMVKARVPVRARTFAVSVSSDSTEPEFTKGDILIIEPDVPFEHEDFVLAKKGSDVFIRQVYKEGPDWLLKPLNKSYATKPLNDYQIVGVVVEKAKFYKKY